MADERKTQQDENEVEAHKFKAPPTDPSRRLRSEDEEEVEAHKFKAPPTDPSRRG